jgi:hypothetical protein
MPTVCWGESRRLTEAEEPAVAALTVGKPTPLVQAEPVQMEHQQHVSKMNRGGSRD